MVLEVPAGVGFDALISAHVDEPGGLLPALHALQRRDGWIDPAAVPLLASAFNVSQAEVHGVITFYKDFRTAPPVGPRLQVCRAEACQARGATTLFALAQHLAATHAVEFDEVFCLGNCALGPSVACAGRLHGKVDGAALEAIVVAAASTSTPPRTAPVPPDATGAADERPAAPPPAEDTTTVVYVPRDAAARAVGADAVAEQFAALAGVRVVRTGSRGLLWLEPMVEVDTPDGRIAYGPVAVQDVPGLLDAGFLSGAEHPLRVGDPAHHPWAARQTRVTFRRVGVIDPRSCTDFEAHGGLVGLRRALAMAPGDVVAEVAASGLRGRGGAAFPTGIKWRTVLDALSPTKYIACNADEGDSGTFADRMLIEGDPFSLIEGMAIAGWAVGAHDGFVYVRSEYPDALEALRAAVNAAEQRGWLGEDVLGSRFAFRVHVREGAGAYVCGEETAMLESLEGRRGVVRAKPPLPALAGLFGQPTVVNNVLTLATVPAILADGAAAYAALGTGRSRGTQVFQLAGNIARGGVVETPFGITLAELVHDLGGGTATGRAVRAVQVGGPLGSYLPADALELPMDYEVFASAGALIGHGGIVVFDDTVDMAAQARFAMEFCAIESCGKCTPCRIGSTRGVELIDRITAATEPAERDRHDRDLVTLADLCEVMADGSLCAMGGLTPLPVRSAMTHFIEDFHRPPGGRS